MRTWPKAIREIQAVIAPAFYEYALGSAREGRDWYYKGRFVIGEAIANHRVGLLTQVTRLLLTMVPQQRGFKIGEKKGGYRSTPDLAVQEGQVLQELSLLLSNIPIP